MFMAKRSAMLDQIFIMNTNMDLEIRKITFRVRILGPKNHNPDPQYSSLIQPTRGLEGGGEVGVEDVGGVLVHSH